MSDPEPLPPDAAPPPAEPQATPPRRRRSVWPALGVLGFCVLLAGLAWLWTQQQALSRAAPAVDPAEIAALKGELHTVQQRLDALPPPPDLAPLKARLASLEARKPEAPADVAPLTEKLDSVAANAAAAKGAVADMSGRLGALESRLAAAEQEAQALSGGATRARILARALVALDAGEPLGEIEGAPPALARFAHAAPPTEASLRLAFPAAAQAAEQASRPSTDGTSFGERMWLRMRSLVTVRQGERVLLGPPAATVLGEAEARLQAGDLAGAVAALGRLDGPAQKAMADWRGQAEALLDARAALAGMAHG